MKNLRRLMLTLICGMLTINPAFGAAKKKTGPPPAVQGPVVASVTATSLTITEDKTTKTLTINKFTEIIVNGQKATAADLKPGMIVSIILGTDPKIASRINATGK
jgi:hypothetical protein